MLKESILVVDEEWTVFTNCVNLPFLHGFCNPPACGTLQSLTKFCNVLIATRCVILGIIVKPGVSPPV